MPALTWTYIFGALTLLALFAGAIVLYRNDDSFSDVSTVGLAFVAFGVLVLGFMTWSTFVAGHHTYELTACEDPMFASPGEGEPFGNLSQTGQEIVRKTHEAGGEYRSLQKPPDFEYVYDQMRETPIEYQGQCYAMLAREGGMGFAGLFLPPILLIGVLSTWVGISKLRSGRLLPPLFGPAVVGILVFGLLFVFTNAITTNSGRVSMLVLSAGAGGLWYHVSPIARLRERVKSLREGV